MNKFLHSIGNIIVACLFAWLFFSQSLSAKSIDIRFVYVGDTEHKVYAGVQLGLKEGNLQGEFLGQRYLLEHILATEALSHDYAPYIAVLAAVDKDTFRKIADYLPKMPVFNLNLEDDALRSECIANALHVVASQRMKMDAEAQWQQKSTSPAHAQVWHHDFKKFAARDLNKRFKRSYKREMDGYAWAGWASVKMVSDVVAREKITQAEDLLRHLKSELNFDGQKGESMNFRPTGQLRQLLLLVDDDNKIVSEAPVRGIASGLDSLGLADCQP